MHPVIVLNAPDFGGNPKRLETLLNEHATSGYELMQCERWGQGRFHRVVMRRSDSVPKCDYKVETTQDLFKNRKAFEEHCAAMEDEGWEFRQAISQEPNRIMMTVIFSRRWEQSGDTLLPANVAETLSNIMERLESLERPVTQVQQSVSSQCNGVKSGEKETERRRPGRPRKTQPSGTGL